MLTVKMCARFRPMIALLAVGLLMVGADASAQGLSLSGTVRDNSGVIPDAAVVLTSAGVQVAETTTDAMGRYRFDGLAAGGFELTVSMRGFEPVVRNIALPAQATPVDIVLAVGRVTTTLTVTAAAGRATASRLPVADDDLPAQVSSVPQELMRQQSVNTVMDALRNASGVQAFRWYGVYEQYTIRGFNDADRDAFNVVLLDGMRQGGNRYSAQTNNIQSIEVLKGAGSVLYGRGAVGGVINIVRKKPQALRAFDVSYRGGSFNTHQGAGGAAGSLAGSPRAFYRVDASFEHSDGWRKAGADRFNLSPSLTFVLGDAMQLTAYQTFNRNRYDGDGGVPLNIVGLPGFKRDLRFSLPQDNVLVEDSQTQLLFSGKLSTAWQFRNSLQFQRTSDRYFVTEGVYGDPDANVVYREPLDFHHIRRPLQNQAELVGHVNRFGVAHNILAGYEYQRDKYRTEVTAGDDPDCLCGYWWLSIAPIDLTTLKETQTPLDLNTVERTTFVSDRVQSAYVQDQIDLSATLKINVAGRVDSYARNVDRIGGFPFTSVRREQTALTYRAGLVYAPRADQQFYVASGTSFTPVTTVPADGSQLDPSTSRALEIGHRWQGWNGRVDTSVAAYHVVRNNVSIRESVTSFIQADEQRSKGLDVDVNTDLGAGTSLIFNYGLSAPVFSGDPSLDGFVPRFVPKHLVNAWLRKDWKAGLNAAFGLRGVSRQFANNTNTLELDGYTTFSGAVGYRSSRWEWSLNADNLFNNENYFLAGHFSNLAFPGAPINVTTTVRLKY